MINEDGTNQTKLTTNTTDDLEPAWSEDGSKIAFATDRNGDFEIYVMKSDGTSPTRLTTNSAYDCCPTWSPGASP